MEVKTGTVRLAIYGSTSKTRQVVYITRKGSLRAIYWMAVDKLILKANQITVWWSQKAVPHPNKWIFVHINVCWHTIEMSWLCAKLSSFKYNSITNTTFGGKKWSHQRILDFLSQLYNHEQKKRHPFFYEAEFRLAALDWFSTRGRLESRDRSDTA